MVNDQEYLDSEGDESGDDENSQNIPEMRG